MKLSGDFGVVFEITLCDVALLRLRGISQPPGTRRKIFTLLGGREIGIVLKAAVGAGFGHATFSEEPQLKESRS
jgi:hypothetical protein